MAAVGSWSQWQTKSVPTEGEFLTTLERPVRRGRRGSSTPARRRPVAARGTPRSTVVRRCGPAGSPPRRADSASRRAAGGSGAPRWTNPRPAARSRSSSPRPRRRRSQIKYQTRREDSAQVRFRRGPLLLNRSRTFLYWLCSRTPLQFHHILGIIRRLRI